MLKKMAPFYTTTEYLLKNLEQLTVDLQEAEEINHNLLKELRKRLRKLALSSRVEVVVPLANFDYLKLVVGTFSEFDDGGNPKQLARPTWNVRVGPFQRPTSWGGVKLEYDRIAEENIKNDENLTKAIIKTLPALFKQWRIEIERKHKLVEELNDVAATTLCSVKELEVPC